MTRSLLTSADARLCALAAFAFAVSLLFGPGRAEAAHWFSSGLRSSASVDGVNKKFEQYEMTGALDLPWAWRALRGEWRTQVAMTAGVIRGVSENGAVVSAGPRLMITWFSGRFGLDGGSAATGITNFEFGRHDFGGPFQFTSHAGASFLFHPHMSVGYRIQHMSNANLFDSNPGLNLHMFEVGYRF